MEYRLGDIGRIVTGKTPSTKRSENFSCFEDIYMFLTPKDMKKEQKYIRKTERYLTKRVTDNFKSIILGSGSVCVSCIGSDMGKVYLIDRKTVTNQQINSITDIKLFCNPEYLYYYFKGKKEFLKSIAGGSTMPILSKTLFSDIIIDLPDKEEQDKIVNVLKYIDEKIEINNQINDNLYNILKRLYKELYLNNNDIIKWKDITLDEATSKFATGLNPRKNFVLGQGSNYYVTIKNMQNNQVILDDKCDKVDDEAIIKINKRSDLQKGDLLFSGIGTIGRVYLIDETPTNWNVSESVFTIRPNELISSEFLYLLLLSSDMQKYSVSLASGSVQKGIRMADFKKYKFKLPPSEFMIDFTNEVKIIIEKIYINNKQNNTLTQLRDTLLPKLMNGKIDLNKIEI
ncbi:MAG: restriction endonuclease subunit S [Clostridia bacterium]|nr:restriction endonuclease subunit S [Clostridia bacterium]MDD4375792.1 restriction endonuclease subunit S [Clostridia bacterium]